MDYQGRNANIFMFDEWSVHDFLNGCYRKGITKVSAREIFRHFSVPEGRKFYSTPSYRQLQEIVGKHPSWGFVQSVGIVWNPRSYKSSKKVKKVAKVWTVLPIYDKSGCYYPSTTFSCKASAMRYLKDKLDSGSWNCKRGIIFEGMPEIYGNVEEKVVSFKKIR